MDYGNSYGKMLKKLLFLAVLFFCACSSVSCLAEKTYTITESQLTAFETNLTKLKEQNKTLQEQLQTSKTQVQNLKMQSEQLQKQVQTLSQSLTNANQLLSKYESNHQNNEDDYIIGVGVNSDGLGMYISKNKTWIYLDEDIATIGLQYRF